MGLIFCLNIGVDPPDSVKSNPCSRMQCWIDPTVLPPQKALEAIGKNLQSQYERWQVCDAANGNDDGDDDAYI